MNLDKLFNAETVAVIGASRDQTKLGHRILATLLEGSFEGRVYPVNPKEKSVLGLKCYHSITDLPEKIDLALVATPFTTLPDLLEALSQKETRGAVILAGESAGAGEEGKRFEDEIVQVAHRHGIRIIGPNSPGIINMARGLNLAGLQQVPRGNIALLTQSGNIALNLIIEAGLKSQVGFSLYVGVGSEADLKFHDYLEYCTADPGTRAILIYVEGLRDGRKFLEQACRTTRLKPIVLYKSGRSVKGSKLAGSQSGTLPGLSEVASSAFKRAGIVEVGHPGEMFPVAETISLLPMLQDNSIAVLADGGGHATIAADYLTDMGLKLPEPGPQTRKRLAALLPANASLTNPVDMAGMTEQNPAVFADCAEILLEDDNIHGLLVVGLFGGYGLRFAKELAFVEEDAAHRMGKLVESSQKPIVMHSLYDYAKPHSLELLRYYGIPVYDSLEIACKGMEGLSTYGSYRREFHRESNFQLQWGGEATPEGQSLIENVRAEGRTALLEHETKELLRLQGIPVKAEYLATTENEAAFFAEKLGYNVALKIVSPQIRNKSAAGGVILGLQNAKEVRAAFRQIISSCKNRHREADIRGCLVAPMSAKGIEFVLGTRYDDQFGPVVMFGLGGIMVSVMKDVSFQVVPVSNYWASSMIAEIKAAVIFDGFRGRPPSDKAAIVELIRKVSDLVQAYPAIRELDLSPVIVHQQGLTVVDARALISRN